MEETQYVLAEAHAVKDKWGRVVCFCNDILDANKIIMALNKHDEEQRKKQEW